MVTPDANYKVAPQNLDANIAILRSAGMVLAQLEIPLETIEYLARICAPENVPFILDPAPARHLPFGLFKNIAWFTPNQTKAASIPGRIMLGHIHTRPLKRQGGSSPMAAGEWR